METKFNEGRKKGEKDRESFAFYVAAFEGAFIAIGSSGGEEGVWNKPCPIGISLPFPVKMVAFVLRS